MFRINIFVYYAVTKYGDGICISKHQIPLDDKSFIIEFVEWDPIELMDFDKMPDSIILENNGKTLVITMNYTGNVPTVAGGPFQDGPFRFDHLYWHWLKSLGSDHTVDDMSIPAELHLVFYDATYGSLEEAAKQPYSIAIMAFNIKVYEFTTTSYEKIVEEVSSIGKEPNMQTVLSPENMLPLQSYITSIIYYYSLYEGSWNAKLCTDNVYWLDFLFPVDIHPEFINELKQMRGNNNKTFMSQSIETNHPHGLIGKPIKRRSNVEVVESIDSATRKLSNSLGVCLILCVAMGMQ